MKMPRFSLHVSQERGFSLTPHFSGVLDAPWFCNRFSGFLLALSSSRELETAEAVMGVHPHPDTPLKRGVNEIRAAFTLIEMVISGAITALILTAAYLCFNAAIAGQKLVEPRADTLQNARVALALLTADLRSACQLSKDYDFLGMQRMIGEQEADNLDFATHNYSPRRPREADYCQVSYFVEKDEKDGDLCLYRRRNPLIAVDPLTGGSRELIARHLRGVQYEYYDGLDWYVSWGETEPKKKGVKKEEIEPNLQGMPEAVRITISLNPNSKKRTALAATEADTVLSDPPLVFQTIARLNLSAASQRGLAGQAGGNSPQPGGNPTPN
jgi:type II secretory pathway component PulJ